MTDIPKPRFTGIFIPVEILEFPGLSLLDKMILSWIDALYSKKYGGCHASNDYLAERLDVKLNTIAKALTRLRSKGLIEDVSFDGRTRVVRSLIYSIIHKNQSKSDLDSQSNTELDKNPTPFGQKSNPDVKTYIYDRKEDRKEEQEIPALTRGLSFFLSEKIKENNPKAKIPDLNSWDKVFDKMLRLDNYTSEEIRELIEFSQKHEFWHRNILSASALRKQANRLTLEKKAESKLSPPVEKLMNIEKNEQFVAEIIKEKKLQPKQVRRETLHVTVKIGNGWTPIPYSENGFQEQFLSALRKGDHL